MKNIVGEVKTNCSTVFNRNLIKTQKPDGYFLLTLIHGNLTTKTSFPVQIDLKRSELKIPQWVLQLRVP